jgi:HEPN domain-containing protein
MNRSDFQALAEIRLKEAKALLDGALCEGAYYLAGYAVECALKACIARQTSEYDFPDKKFASDIHTHDLRKLLDLAGLKSELESTPELEHAWEIVQEWSEASRYKCEIDLFIALDLVLGIESDDGKRGLLPWIRQRW